MFSKNEAAMRRIAHSVRALNVDANKPRELFSIEGEEKADISIITVSNRPQNLLHLAQQVLKQDFKGSLEHVIVIDGLEVTAEKIKELQNCYKKSGKNI